MGVTLDDKYILTTGRAYLTGIEALVRLPILQRQRDMARGLNTAGFISGYRGSPLGGLDNALWHADAHLKKHHIRFQPGVNEELAATSLWGSQQVNLYPDARYDGVFGMWYGKGPGLDRAMDAVKHANNAGTSKFGGVLAVVGDDHLCKSSTLAFQSEQMFVAATIPVLNPAGVQDVLDLGIYGWEMSRFTGSWVGMKTTAENMDAAISADINPQRLTILLPTDFAIPADGLHIRWPDHPLEQEKRLQRHKIYAAQAFARANKLDRIVVDSSRPRFGIIAAGKAYLDTVQALSDLGIDSELAQTLGVRVYKVGMSWPLEPEGIREFVHGLQEVLVVEEKRSLMEDQLKSMLYALPSEQRPRIVGEYDERGALLVSNVGELNPVQIAEIIVARLANFGADQELADKLSRLQAKHNTSLPVPGALPIRQPWFCSGCPHNTSTKVPEGSRALAGIGCHFMATWMDRKTETFTQMGGEGASWIGQAPFTETRHVFQNLGDGTYFHSGILAVRAAIASRANITYKILYNDAVAMTGGQPIDGIMTVEQMVYQLIGEGVKRIALVSDLPEKYQKNFPRFAGLSIDHRDNFDSIQLEMRELPGTTVIIYEQTCGTEKRRRRKRGLLVDPPKRVFINQQVCEGCGDCGVQSNCLAVIPKETSLGRKRAIDQSACNKDFSCLKGFCPSFVTVHGGQLHKQSAASGDVSFAELPEPVLPDLNQPYSILLAGVGGMGVLTVGSIMGMAAHIEDKGSAVLTQTGLAQKFGAVTSHVRIARCQEDLHGMRVPVGGGQLLLGADLVVSSGADSLLRIASGAAAVVNNHDSPTAEFTHNPDAPFPEQAMEAAIQGVVGPDRAHFMDATGLGTALLGDAIAANLFLLGFAWQKSLVPIGREALEEAIRLNGVAVELNLKAFLWGRRYALHPQQVNQHAGIAPTPAASSSETVEEVISDRRTRLVAYQNENYARRYTALVTRVEAAERQLAAGQNKTLTLAVAKNYFKLLAYKDEYEVARLYTDGEFRRQLAEQFDGNYKLSFHLAPPLLSRRDPVTGHLRKREFGPWIFGAFRLLAKLKFLRGTAWDIMGRSAERKMERQLIVDYEVKIDEVLANLNAENYAVAVEIAALPEFIRGYGHVKDNNVAVVARRGEELNRKYAGGETQVVKIQEAADAVH